LTTQSYYDESYDAVIEYGDRAIQARPNNVDVRRVVAQALIRRERYQEAETHIDHMIHIGALKEAFYVKGFLERKRKQYHEAIAAYKRSVEYGRRGVAIHRELAQCYFKMRDLDKARAHISLAEEADPHNRFLVDLKCTIATKLGHKQEVLRCLQLLEKIDNGGFAHHRRSRFELSEGRPHEALHFASLAIEHAFRPSFEIVANRANCFIECGFDDEAASAIHALDQRFSSTYSDARLGLHCKLELRRGDIVVAESFWKRIIDKGAPVHMAIRASILKGKKSIQVLPEVEELELETISAKLRVVDDDLDFIDE
jgi:tetratricopeptide (TPR) repeat protein